jgi:hypothetical protein
VAIPKWLNGIIAGARVIVENTIASVKRCRIVKGILRNTKEGFSDLVMEVACALHNLMEKSNKHRTNSVVAIARQESIFENA